MTECAIRLTPQTRGRLSALTELEFVNLSHNPLGHAPDVSALHELVSLYLSNAALSEVPQGVFGLEQLQTLDLSNNAIQQIPADLLETSATLNGDCDLSGNPLSAQSIERLRQYYQRTGVDFQVAAATVDAQGTPLIAARPDPEED
ncbi:leucine-rich repeat domain-containing protein [Pseudomonas fluorescens]|nr:leucine-rich repeat domain-containing protein [Pseudomonas fluorescens]